ncbi:MAG: hypothetical protein ABSF34_05020 [Verrucomicrobiota bacterium]|jgi:PBP1b-binding outer membrane lipoprotein LpoB
MKISKLYRVSAIVLAALVFAGCSSMPLHPVGSVLTNASSILAGKQVPMDKFTTQDIIRYYTSFTWDDVTQSGGQHEVTWNWYKGDVLISTVTKNVVFHHAPFQLWTTRAAAALGVGKFRIDVLIDGDVKSSVTFEIQ